MNQRRFDDTPAGTTARLPLWLGLYGPTGGGKTYSALRLATGIQRVYGGKLYVIDTEANRALHYATPRGPFCFGPHAPEGGGHVPFSPPYGPDAYLDAIRHCVAQGARVIVIDSFSHEHEGEGGVLELHDDEVQRRSKGDWKKAKQISMSCWIAPKRLRTKTIMAMLQMDCAFVLCMRAKEKIKPVAGKEPIQLGWMPIGGQEYLYETMACALLDSGADGVPSWTGERPGERNITKRPRQFLDVLVPGKQIDEDMGEAMARWANGERLSSPGAASQPVNSCFANVKWSGTEEWTGKPLVSASLDELRDYRGACSDLTSKRLSDKKRASLLAHIREVDALIAQLDVPDLDFGDIDPDGSGEDDVHTEVA